MELFLRGHTYKYAAEQSLLCLYPEERPLYPSVPSGADSAELTMTRGGKYCVCVCRLHRGECRSRGEARCVLPENADKVTEDRLLQRIVKQAFFRAALAQGHELPAWGSLTGVRPGKLFLSLRREGLSEAQTVRRFQEEFRVSPERTELVRQTSRAAENALSTLGERDVCLYIGIPFCPTRCAYCSFISIEASQSLRLLPDYLAAQERELAALADAVREAGARIVSVYIGGGTPTTLSAEQLTRLISVTRSLFDLSACREFTVEAGRPDTITPEKLRALREQGVTRVSVNPQTMNDAVLEYIGRFHSAEDIRRAYAMVRSCGDLEVNMDLIAGLPLDTPESFEATVRELIAMEPENITIHTLALKRGSRFLKEGTPLPGAKEVAEMLDRSRELLYAAGYLPYYLYRQKFMSGSFENVGWTKPGRENLYNICIMEELCAILASGAGGSTKLVENGSVRRLTVPKYPREYTERMDAVCEGKREIVDFFRELSAGKKS